MKFAVGQRIRVVRRQPAGHYRTPRYLWDRVGVIDAQLGYFRNPEKLAYHLAGLPAVALYRVRFTQALLFDTGDPRDVLSADLYEHWLEPVA